MLFILKWKEDVHIYVEEPVSSGFTGDWTLGKKKEKHDNINKKSLKKKRYESAI